MQRAHLHPSVFRAPLELAVERSETVLSNLLGASPPAFELVARSEILGRKLMRAPAQATRDVATVESQLLAVPVDTAHDGTTPLTPTRSMRAKRCPYFGRSHSPSPTICKP
jgi:hypothetical protein